MSPARSFPAAVLSAIGAGRYLRIRAGSAPHRFIGIWAVVVEKRVFVRAYYFSSRSWYRTFLVEPRGAIQVEGRVREIPVRALQTQSERLKSAVDAAYESKYRTRANIPYVKDMVRKGGQSRECTIELAPVPARKKP
jgi:hypothetical protein